MMLSHTGSPGRPGTAAGPPWRQPQVVRTSELRGCEDLVGFWGSDGGGDTHLGHFAPKKVIMLQRDKVRSVSAQIGEYTQPGVEG